MFFSLVHRSNFLTESGTRNCVTHYFEVFLALRIRVLVAGSRNVTSEDFSLVRRSNFLTESGTPIHRRYRACVTTWRFFSLCGSSCESGSQRVIPKDSSEKFCNFADIIAAISLTSSQQFCNRIMHSEFLKDFWNHDTHKSRRVHNLKVLSSVLLEVRS